MFSIIDCNNFYVSCERVFRPDLEHQPVLVTGNNDGCIIARSNEVKALGIAMGAPLHTIRPLIQRHQIAVFSANYALYGDMSQRVMRVIEEQTSGALEIYSIDEAFVKLNTSPAQLEPQAAHLRSIVRQQTGIPVSIGIAATKTLAKLANTCAKKLPTGVISLSDDHSIDELLRVMPVDEVWGIGAKRAEWLIGQGIRTAYQLKCADPVWIQRHLTAPAARIVWELRGVSCLPLDADPAPKKEICTSRAFGKAIQSEQELAEAVAFYTSRAAEKLHKQGGLASLITVFLHTNPFQPDLPQYAAHCKVPLAEPTGNAAELIAAAKRGLRQCYKQGYFYHKAGVILSQITSETMAQGTLFPLARDSRDERLQAVVDIINRTYGRNTMYLAACGTQRTWQMKQGRRSPRYTTSWDELLKV